ncbi:uncharacterized protein JCM15063_000456 [Sporobolomyces koalae]|uniref:uncharacterized protein n=1 Tax=Sporobolomyces koalae TaxID=500713 RepID=UPI0031805C6C
MVREVGTSSLATWLHRYNRGACIDNLEETLEADQQLALALQRLKDATNHQDPATTSESDFAHAQKKIENLRRALSHFTSHANSLAERLAHAESELVAAQHRHTQEIARLGEEKGAIKSLCQVWEGRWREERATREDLEHHLRNLTGRERGNGNIINDAKVREQTRMVTSIEISPERPTSAELFNDLASETERMRADMKSLCATRDVELVRLEAEIQLRRTEMAQLYSSLDQLLCLSPAITTAPTDSLDVRANASDAAKMAATRDIGSVLDLPAIQAAASYSRSRQPLHPLSGDQTIEEVAETLQLEQEIREMEKRIRLLSGGPQSDASSVKPLDGSSSGGVEHERLQGELEAVKRDLAQALREKADLERQHNEVR